VKCVKERTDITEEAKRKLLSANGIRFYGLEAEKASGTGK